MGTRCGPQYVDIQVVHLSGPRSQYVDNFSAIVQRGRATARQLLRPAQRRDPGRHAQRRQLRLRARRERPRLSRRPPRRGQRPQRRRVRLGAVLARRPGRARRRRARLVAGGLPARDHPQPRRRPVVGPALDTARRFALPRYGHCWQGADVMCYVEDSGAAHAMRTTARASAARSRRPTTAAATTTSTPPCRPAATWRRTGTSTTAPSWPRARRSRPRAAAGWTGSSPRRRSPRAARELAGIAAPRLEARRRRRRLAQRPADLRLPLAAPGKRGSGRTSRAPRGVLQRHARRPRPPAARPGRRHQPGRQRLGRSAPSAPRGRRHGRPGPQMTFSKCRSASRAELDGLLPGAAVVELQSEASAATPERGHVVHPARLRQVAGSAEPNGAAPPRCRGSASPPGRGGGRPRRRLRRSRTGASRRGAPSHRGGAAGSSAPPRP